MWMSCCCPYTRLCGPYYLAHNHRYQDPPVIGLCPTSSAVQKHGPCLQVRRLICLIVMSALHNTCPLQPLISNCEINRSVCTPTTVHHPPQTTATDRRPYCKVLTWNRPSPCSACCKCNSMGFGRLEKTSRATSKLQTWTGTDANSLKPANIGLHTAWRRAQDRADWRNLVTTATHH